MKFKRCLAALLACMVIGAGVCETALPVNAITVPITSITKEVNGYNNYTVETYDEDIIQAFGIFSDNKGFTVSCINGAYDLDVCKNQFYEFKLDFDLPVPTPDKVVLYQKVNGKWVKVKSKEYSFKMAYSFDTVGKSNYCLKYIYDGNLKSTSTQKGVYKEKKAYFTVNVKDVKVPNTVVVDNYLLFANKSNLSTNIAFCGDDILCKLSEHFIEECFDKVELYKSTDGSKWTKVYQSTDKNYNIKFDVPGEYKYCCKLYVHDRAGVKCCIKSYANYLIKASDFDLVDFSKLLKSNEKITGVRGKIYSVGNNFSKVRAEDYGILQKELIKRYNENTGITSDYTFTPIVIGMNDMLYDVVKEITGVQANSCYMTFFENNNGTLYFDNRDKEVKATKTGVYNIKLYYSLPNSDKVYKIALLNMPILSEAAYKALANQKDLGIKTGV